MSLLKEWRDYAYSLNPRSREGQVFWARYFAIEKGIYEQLLSDPKTVVKGTVAELAEKYATEISGMTDRCDGGNCSRKTTKTKEGVEGGIV
ncbi:MAG: SEC-C domain-containing protein, partial [Lachnospiraceae bacterium]|nr:SEC-C domain-containing protein [Lachnospiraceae bacterium]